MVAGKKNSSEPPLADLEIEVRTPAATASSPISNSHLEPLELIESPKSRSKLRLWIILISLYLALFVAALDQTIITQSIPTICHEFSTASGYVWVGGAYMLANAVSGPIWSKCSDIWGRKLLLLTAIALFAASSIIAALSTSMSMLIAARALQGLASGGLMQLSIITISDLFSVRRRSLFLGFSGFMWALAASTGPFIGGAFTEFRSWRYCFWINVPICGSTFILLLFFMDVHNPRTGLSDGLKAIDWLGTIFFLAIAILLLLGLQFGGSIFPWSSPKFICVIVVGTLMIGVFIFTEKRLANYPLMKLTVFKSWSNNAIFVVVFSHSMVLIGITYYMPLYFQSVRQASPFQSGILLLPLIVTQAIGEIMSGVVINRTGRYLEVIWAGVIFMTLGTGLYILLGPGTSVVTTVGLLLFGALGPGLLIQGPMVAIQNSVGQIDTSDATSCLMFFRSIAQTLSVVVGGVVFQNSMDARQSTLRAAGLSESLLVSLSGGEAAANVGIASTIEGATHRQAVTDAFAWSMRNMFIMYTSIAFTAVMASVFIRHQDLSKEHTETKTGIPKSLEVRRGVD